MVFIHICSMMMLTTSFTSTTRMLSMFTDTTLTGYKILLVYYSSKDFEEGGGYGVIFTVKCFGLWRHLYCIVLYYSI